jgi:hypothetical protein
MSCNLKPRLHRLGINTDVSKSKKVRTSKMITFGEYIEDENNQIFHEDRLISKYIRELQMKHEK